MDITVILSPLFKMAIMILLGYVGVKTKYINTDIKDALSKLILRYAIPLLTITSISGQDISGETVKSAGLVIVISICFFATALLVGLLSAKLFRLSSQVESVHACVVAFYSIAFMGYPLVRDLFGESGFFLAVMATLVFDTMLYSVGVFVIAKSSGGGILAALKKLINPTTIAVFAGLLMLFCGWRLPPVLHDSLATVGGILTPLAMLFVGISLAEIKMGNIFRHWQILVITPIKMILLPLLLAFVLVRLGLDSMLITVLALIFAMPSISVLAAIANEFGADSYYATEGVFVTTIFSLVSLPVVYMVVQTMLS